MALITPLRYLRHEHLGDILILESDDGWAEVGTMPSGDRREHWMCLEKPIAIRCVAATRTPAPFLSAADAKRALIGGHYAHLRETDEHLRAAEQLMIGNTFRELSEPLKNLSAREAEIICLLNQGRLATEKEADLILRQLTARPSSLRQIWTSSLWSMWNYSLCYFHQGRWCETTNSRLHQQQKRSLLPLNGGSRLAENPLGWLSETGAIMVFDP